jgi:hypothetical protein
MLSAMANLGWISVLCSIGVVCGIGWVYRARHAALRQWHQKLQGDRLTHELYQEEDEFEDAEDIIMVSDDDDDSEPEISLPARHPVVQARSQLETSIPSNTVQVIRKP